MHCRATDGTICKVHRQGQGAKGGRSSNRWSWHRNPHPSVKTVGPAFLQEHRPCADGKWPEVQIAGPRSGPLILFAYPCCHHKKSCETKRSECPVNFSSIQAHEYTLLVIAYFLK